MQANERARELERVYKARRGHATQISISDDSHHVTEAIGDMYGDNDFSRRDSRPLSFIQSPTHENFESSYFDTPRSPPGRHPLTQSTTHERPSPPGSGPHSPTMLSPGSPADRGSTSPPKLNRQSSGPASQTFEFQDIDYQSSPAAVAQELSNLQAIRRMSMDVNNSDPDLPSFSGNVPVPAVAPSHSADDDDPSRLFWVPARVHPELAPKEFKTFIEEKVDKHRRRSSAGSDDSLLSPGALDRQGSGGGLRRKKSMLSKQVDGPSGYRDGADRLERNRSSASQKSSAMAIPSLHQLEELAEDPATLIQQVNLRDSVDSGVGVAAAEDIPILPVKPGLQSLKRSTRTNYRRGSLRKGERVPFSRRMAGRQGQEESVSDDSPGSSPVLAAPPEPNWGLTRTQTEPTPPKPELPGNFSRPNRARSPSPSRESDTMQTEGDRPSSPELARHETTRTARPFHSRIASNGRTTAPLPGYTPNPVPQIVETPPPADRPPPQAPPPKHPERKSSKNAQDHPPLVTSQSTPPRINPPPASRKSPNKPTLLGNAASTRQKTQTLDDMASHPTAIPGHTSATSTDSLSIIPTFAEEKKPEGKSDGKKSRKGHDSEGGRKSSWGWFSRGEDKEEEKEKDRKEKDEPKKLKSKLTRPADKSHDNTRLDVLQTSIDGGKGRESLVLDRDSVKLEEERKKESARKSSKEDKKDKDGLFSSLFSSKKKGDRDSGGKKAQPQRGLSPDPPLRILKPDIDYNWTRFSILEERAIYRMAHIKLANPRRELHSQVLLSNFMYSYLAKVQQMHPHIQIGQGTQQKQVQRQAQQQKKHEQQQQQQPEEYQQYQRYQEQQGRPESSADGASASGDGGSSYYGEHDHRSEEEVHGRSDPRGSHHSHGSQQSHGSHGSHGRSNGNGYSVASGQSYLGVQGGQSQSYDQYESDDDGPPENDMW